MKSNYKAGAGAKIAQSHHAVVPNSAPVNVSVHGPRYWRSIWKKAVDHFYGDAKAAEKWMMTPWHPFSEKRPVDLTIDPKGRAQVDKELDRLEQFKLDGRPRTAWRACRSFFPCKFNGELMFRNTEIPAPHLFYHLKQGGNLEGFLREHPEVKRAQVQGVFDQVILDLCDW